MNWERPAARRAGAGWDTRVSEVQAEIAQNCSRRKKSLLQKCIKMSFKLVLILIIGSSQNPRNLFRIKCK